MINHQSPGLGMRTPMSPNQHPNMMSGFVLPNTGIGMKYSPMTPNQNYLNPHSPNVINSGMRSMSPTFQY